MQPPASEAAIADMQAAAVKALGDERLASFRDLRRDAPGRHEGRAGALIVARGAASGINSG
jgi:hypothetical protein